MTARDMLASGYAVACDWEEIEIFFAPVRSAPSFWCLPARIVGEEEVAAARDHVEHRAAAAGVG